MDDLLDKINRKGYDSLTPREKELLDEAVRNLDAEKKDRDASEEEEQD